MFGIEALQNSPLKTLDFSAYAEYSKLMKTVREISVEQRLNRSTLLKAAQRGIFGNTARKSGATWLIDDESEAFKVWLAGSKIGRPRKTR